MLCHQARKKVINNCFNGGGAYTLAKGFIADNVETHLAKNVCKQHAVATGHVIKAVDCLHFYTFNDQTQVK